MSKSIKLLGRKGAMLGVLDPPSSLRQEMIRLCTFDNPQYVQAMRYSQWEVTRIPPKVCIAVEQDAPVGSLVFVPRGFPARLLSPANKALWDAIEWVDARTTAPTQFPPVRLKLNAEQLTLVDNFKQVAFDLDECPFGNVLYIAPTGTGKTITQAVMAAATKQRTLVIFQTELIRRAWVNDLKATFGIPAEKLGLIQRGVFKIGDHFTLASLQTLNRRRHRWEEISSLFGCLIVDETDTITASTLNSFVLSCASKYLIGATATHSKARAKGGFYLPALFGAVRKRILSSHRDTQTSMALREVEEVLTDFTYDQPNDVPIDWHDLAYCLSHSVKRNRLICEQVRKYHKAGESVLVVTKRLDHVRFIERRLREAPYEIEDTNTLTGEQNQNHFYMEKLLEAIRQRDIRCIVATQQAIKRGANLNEMSVLILAIPVANTTDLEQLIGRIRRWAPLKKTCKLVYLLDHNVRYLSSLFGRVAIPVFRKLRVKNYENTYRT